MSGDNHVIDKSKADEALAASPAGSPGSLDVSIARQDGESLEDWAKRFVAVAPVQERHSQRRGWSPLRVLGLSVTP